MRDPRAVEAVARLALLVLAHLRERDLVHLRILAGRDERRHPADRVRTAPVARADEQLRVRAHERHGHRHLDAVGQHPVARAELLDRAEDVVPAAGVERAAPVAELVEDLLHLERGEDRLDQDGAADRPAGGRAPPRRARTRRPRAAPRGATRASGGRSTARCRARAARARCAPVQAEVEERRRDRLAVDQRSAARGGASRAGGSGASRSRRSARYVLSGVSSEISRRTASVTFRCPSTTFSQVGEHASS